MAGTGRGFIGVQRNHPMAQGHMPKQMPMTHDVQNMSKPEAQPCSDPDAMEDKKNGQGGAEEEGE